MVKRLGIVPLAQMNSRPPEAGRIRLGKKTAKGAPGKLTALRFTSPYKDVLDELAPFVGGVVEPWNDPKATPRNQFELLSTVKEIDVFLVPGSLSCNYEMWSGGGCERRCDGITCETPIAQGDESYLGEVPCRCVAQNVRLCEPYTRLQVLIPQIKFRGVWRLDTKGWNAQAELPGMFELIQSMNDKGGMVQAVLGMTVRERQTQKGLNSWVQPTLSVKQNLLEIQQGLNAAAALTVGGSAPHSTPALPAAPPSPMTAAEPLTSDDDVAEAEIVDEEWEDLEAKIRSDAAQFNLDPDRFVDAMVRAVSTDAQGKPESLESRKVRLANAHALILAETLVPLGFTRDGKVSWK